jgi:predicted esterase
MNRSMQTDPHADQPVLAAGRPVEEARAALVMIHGRGASAAGILELADELPHDEFAYVAPQAAGGTWYPFPFLAPLDRNEPNLSSALRRIGDVLAQVAAAGVPTDRIVLLGFSQGACLAAEFVARNARRYGGLLVFSGGLIGPDGTPRDYAGSLDGTPVFLGCSDVDPHIPVERVHESADVFERMGAAVTKRIYPGMPHTVNSDEIRWARDLLARLGSDS